MKNICIFLFLLIRTLCFYGQVYQPIVFPEKVNAKYIMNPLKEQEKLYKKLSKSLPKRVALDYSVAQTFGKAELFKTGEIYLSWPAMEAYVNQVLDSIIPANLASKKIQAFIGRSSDINAYCLYDGTIVVNAGLLAEVKSEAALAAVMGHELTHFIKNHGLNRVRNQQKKDKKKSLIEKALNVRGFSQENELEADLMGFAMVRDANYDLEDANSNFELFIRESEYSAKRYKSTLANTDSVTINTSVGKFNVNTLEKLLSTHPEDKLRKDKLAAYIKSNPQTKKIKFKIDEDYFMALQAQARLECVNLLFDDNNYQECLERSFLYNLFNPGELSFSYYIAESVRRICLLDYRMRKKGFLAEQLVNDGFKEGQGILHDLKFLVPDPQRYKNIQAVELLKTGAFETYRDAFAYFTKRLLDRKYNEAYLMRALFENNKAKVRDNIAKYLASPNIKHKEYAMNYRDSTLAKIISGNSKEMVMIPRVDFFRDAVYNYQYRYGDVDFYFKKSEIVGTEMSYEFATTFNEQAGGVTAISMPQAATQNFNTMYKDATVWGRAQLASRDENEGYKVEHYYKELEDEDYISNVDIFRLDPDTWEFFKANGINVLTYASYTRHTNLGAKKMRVLLFFLGIPTVGLTWLFIPFNTVQYRELEARSYDTSLGSMCYDSEVRKRRITANKALRMFNDMKKKRTRFIKEYNNKY